MKFCTALLCTCLLTFAAWAGVKSDPATGLTSDGVAKTPATSVTFEIPGLLDLDALENELDGLYVEAEFLKYAGHDDAAVWSRIKEILNILEPRNESDNLDEGGETWESAVIINSLPYCDGGNTNDNVNDYGAPNPDCSPAPPGARGKDVVYRYTTGDTDEVISISLCGSSYDTYLHVYLNTPPATGSASFACNDDNGGTCPSGTNNLRSCIPNLTVAAWDTIYIVVDGWSTSSNGSYNLNVTHDIRCEPCTPPPPPPCVECPADAYVSIEPVCYNGYVDQTNSNCAPNGEIWLEDISCNSTVCGTGGSYFSPTGQPRNDEDWFRLNVTAAEDSVFICFKGVRAGAWALYRITGPNPCGGDNSFVVNGTFPECQTMCLTRCLEPGEYWLGIGFGNSAPCGSPYRIDIQCLSCGNEPTGRCCYASPNGDFCSDGMTAAACAELGGDWLEGASCTSAPCVPPTGRCCYVTDAAGPSCEDDVTRDWCAAVQGHWAMGETCESACCITDYCAWPIVVPGVLQYTNTENTCCATDVPWQIADLNCGPNTFPAGGAIIYKIVLDEPGTLDISVSGPTDNQLMIFTDCNDPEGTCVASADNATDNVGNIYQGATEQLLGLTLPAGTYYVATATYIWSNNTCGPITLTIVSDVPLPAELTSFDAVAGDASVTLNWATGSESNLDHFSLMRDGALITEVDAANSATGGNYSWTDNGLTNGTTYEYTLVSVDFDGASQTLGIQSAAPNAGNAIVTEYALYQNYPNPFNPETSISFDLVDNGPVKLSVFNALGQTVAVLVDGMQTAGRHTVTFDGTALTSGLYFYRLDAGDFTAIHKMALIK